MTNNDKIRQIIASFNGARFTAYDVIEASKNRIHKTNIYTMLTTLCISGEIIDMGKVNVRQHRKPMNSYRAKADFLRANDVDFQLMDSPWESIYPEFFTPPKISGKLRINVLEY